MMTCFFFKKNIKTVTYLIDSSQPWLTSKTCNLGHEMGNNPIKSLSKQIMKYNSNESNIKGKK